MLEGLVANLLNRVLGIYLQNFDPKQLSVGIWNGEVKLRNLELRKEALDQLHLPLNVVEGHIGNLTLSIPFSNLRGKPVQVSVEDVFILASPREDADFDPEQEEKRTNAVKLEKLESAELLKDRNTDGMSKEEQQKQQSFTASLTTAIIDNLQVTVKNIHVRYEDSISDPGHPFAAGLTLGELSAYSTNEHWAPTFIQSTSGSTHKLAKLGALAIYWDTDTSLLATGKSSTAETDPARILTAFMKMSNQAANDPTTRHQYILKPISGQAGIEMDKTGKTDVARIKTRLFFDELGFMLDEDQYRDSLMLIDLFHSFIRHQEHKKYQPKSRPKEDPRAWFQFVGNAVLDKIKDRNRRWTWAYFRERRDDRRRYIELFKKRKKEEKLTAAEQNQLSALEQKLSYEDLRFWRSLARNQLRKENVGVKKPPPKQTWSSWIWGGGQQQAQSEDTQMTEEQKSELYNAIDWDERKALAESVDLPKETVKLQTHMSLQTGSFTLKRNPHVEAEEVLKLLFDSFNIGFVQRPDSLLAQISLQGMRLYDGTTSGSLFPQIVTVKDATPVSDQGKKASEKSTEEVLGLSEGKMAELHKSAFFSLSFEQHPLDGHADSVANVKLRGMEIVYNPRFVVGVTKFFKPPERHMESIGALMDSANEAVEGIRKQTRAGLEFALEEHKSIDLQLDMQAPLILVPDTVTRESSLCLILDAGHISMNSELVDKESIKEIQSKQSKQYTDEDYRHLEGLMYDKLNVRLQSTQLLIGPSMKATREQLEARDDSKNLHVIDRINMNFLVETCIVPKGTQLTRFRITGNLPVLHASISDAKYKNLMRLLDVAIPKFDEDDPSKPAAATANRPPEPKSPAAVGKRPENNTKPRSKSFQFAAQEHELLIEEEDDYDKQQEFQDAVAGDEETAAPMHRRNFEFKFVVEKLQGSLFQSDPQGRNPDKKLAELVANQFSLDFYQRPYDMVAEVSLGSLALEDHVEQNPLPEFKDIVSSEEASAASPSKLFQLKFAKVNPESPEFMTHYQGVATNLDVSMSTINLIVTRSTLLTLLDFIMVTFTSPSEPRADKATQPAKVVPEKGVEEEKAASQSADKIRIKADLKGIAIVLNNDGIRLATLKLTTASVGLMLMGKTMRLGAKIGDLSLVDDVNQGASASSPFRQLITIQGQELVDFSYETFDSEADTYPGHDTSIRLRSGSIKVNFVTEPFRKMMEFGVKFGKMQALANMARQAAANQAEQMQERTTNSKMHLDVLIKTPIIVFPRVIGGEVAQQDLLTAYLGEIYAYNSFKPLEDSEKSDTATLWSAGIRNIRLMSLLHYPQDTSEELEMIDKVDLDFNVTMVDHKPGYKRPDMEVVSTLSNIRLRTTPQQLRLIMGLSQSIPQAFTMESDEQLEKEAVHDVPAATKDTSKAVDAIRSKSDDNVEKPAHLGPELGSDPEKWTKMDLVFRSGSVGLELMQAQDDSPVGDLESASLSKFSLNQTNVKLRMMTDGAIESELLIQSFTIEDTRKQEANRFRKIMSLINTDVSQQFMANVTISRGTEKNLLAILTIDSPRAILAVNYLMAVQVFLSQGLSTDSPATVSDALIEEEASNDTEDKTTAEPSSSAKDQDGKNAEITSQSGGGMSISFRVNLVDAQAIVIANPASNNSEAIVLSMKQAIVAQQHAMTLQVEKIGMFLCRMDKFESNRLRILDDFSIATSVDQRSQSKDSSMTNIQVDIEPLVLRLSLRDVLLATQIFTQVTSSMAPKAEDQKPKAPEKAKESKAVSSKKQSSAQGTTTARTPKTRRASATPPVKQASESVMLKREEMNIRMSGIRVILIGDVHELPIFDWSVKEFRVEVHDWSGSMSAETSMDTYMNIYNFSKSAWEPLMEPWSIGFHMSKDQSSQKLSVDIFSRKMLEMTLTSASIALASKTFQYISTNEDVLTKPRGSDAPYRIRNYSGFTMNIWAQMEDGREGSAAKVSDGEEVPWRFEDPKMTRETLSPEGMSGIVGVNLENSGFDSLDRISVTREGERVYSLPPRKDGVLHRFLVEVKLGPNRVKYITFRSPLVVENNTQIPIELGVFSPDEGLLVKIEKIAPGEARPSPVGAAFMHSLVIRPDPGFGYSWSKERLFWKDLLKRPTGTISCKGEQQDSMPPFYFQMNAVFDRNDPLAL